MMNGTHTYQTAGLLLDPANTTFSGNNSANFEKPRNYSGICSLKCMQASLGYTISVISEDHSSCTLELKETTFCRW
jgi:hypothetical protein